MYKRLYGPKSLRPFFDIGLLQPSANPRDTSAYNADFFGPTRPSSKVPIFVESQSDKDHFFYFTLKFFFLKLNIKIGIIFSFL